MTRKKGQRLSDFVEDYIVIDIETTGLSPYKNEIIELSALEVKNNQVINEFTSLVKPEGRINYYITKLTGISNGMVQDAPMIEDILPEFYDFIGESVLLGHNINFDINFIYENLLKCLDKHFDNDFVDLLTVSRKAIPDLPNHKLKTIADYFNIDSENMHRGLVDCHITHKCFIECKAISGSDKAKAMV